MIFTDEAEARAYAEKRIEAWHRYRQEARAIEIRQKEALDCYRAEIEALP